MNNIELIKKIEELKELEALIREAEAEVEALKDEIKNEMQNREVPVEEMCVGRYIVRWKNVSSDKFDSKTFKNACPDVYKMYVKHTVGKRFTITG